jgi:hypothetical protein
MTQVDGFEEPSADVELIDDPAALEAAQAAANAADPDAAYASVEPDWVVVWGPAELGITAVQSGQNATCLTIPLDAEGIAYAWDPFPPSETFTTRNIVARPLSLLVSPSNAARARNLLQGAIPDAALPTGSVPSAPPVESLEDQRFSGILLAIVMVMLAVGAVVIAAKVAGLL